MEVVAVVSTERLRPKQQRFVDEYLVDLNATQAAIRAGYSLKTAGSIGFDLLKKPEIQVALAEQGAVVAERNEITQDMIIREYARIAFASSSSVMSWDADGVKLKNSEELTEDEVAAVAEVSQTKTKDGGTIRLKLHDKKGALDSLAARLWPMIERSEQLNLNVNVDLMKMVEIIKRLKLTPEQLDEWQRILDQGGQG